MSSCLGNPQSLAEEGTGVWAECLAGEEASCDGAEQGKWPERQGYCRIWQETLKQWLQLRLAGKGQSKAGSVNYPLLP